MQRKAELRDLPELDTLFMQLLLYLMKHGEPKYCNDYNILRNGVVAYLSVKIMDENSLTLVVEKEGQIKGFLIGMLVNRPTIYQDTLVGQIEWLYPLSIIVRGMVREFERWAREMGATAGFNTVMVPNERARNIMQVWGMVPQWQIMMKPYGVNQ